MYKPYIDENNRIHIFCLCDGTYIFLLQLVKVLAEMGCSDIHTNGDIVTEGIPEDKPWCNYLFEASGILPEEEVWCLDMSDNKALTLEQLRQMDGEPVWGKSLITEKPGEWFILRVVEMSKTWFIACAGAEQGFGDKDTYGKTWLAYRRPPEGET